MSCKVNRLRYAAFDAPAIRRGQILYRMIVALEDRLSGVRCWQEQTYIPGVDILQLAVLNASEFIVEAQG